MSIASGEARGVELAWGGFVFGDRLGACLDCWGHACAVYGDAAGARAERGANGGAAGAEQGFAEHRFGQGA